MMFVLATAVRAGARAGLLATLGVATSEILQITAVAAGLAALFAAAPATFTTLRICGALYVLYLGIQAFRSARRGGGGITQGQHEGGQSRNSVSGRYAFLRGAVTNLVNPKMVTFAVAVPSGSPPGGWPDGCRGGAGRARRWTWARER